MLEFGARVDTITKCRARRRIADRFTDVCNAR
jgi:hypothetical protein